MDPTQKPPQKSYKFQILIKHFINIVHIVIKHAANHVDGQKELMSLNAHILAIIDCVRDALESAENIPTKEQTPSLSPKQSIKIMYAQSQKQNTTKAWKEQTSIKGSINNKRKTSTS